LLGHTSSPLLLLELIVMLSWPIVSSGVQNLWYTNCKVHKVYGFDLSWTICFPWEDHSAYNLRLGKWDLGKTFLPSESNGLCVVAQTFIISSVSPHLTMLMGNFATTRYHCLWPLLKFEPNLRISHGGAHIILLHTEPFVLHIISCQGHFILPSFLISFSVDNMHTALSIMHHFK